MISNTCRTTALTAINKSNSMLLIVSNCASKANPFSVTASMTRTSRNNSLIVDKSPWLTMEKTRMVRAFQVPSYMVSPPC